MFRELIQDHIGNRGLIVPAGEIFPTAYHNTRYCSLFMFDKGIQPYVKIHKSVKGYKGKVYCEAIWIDVDNDKDVNEARLSAIEIIKRLNADYGINPDHLLIYFSGKKGFHLAIYNGMVGFTHTTAVEPDKIKDFVSKLTEGIPHVDLVIYEPVRIFRIENSRHEKSGLYKVRLSFTELQCEMEDILAIAAQPRQFPYKVNLSGIPTNNKLNQLWVSAGNYIQEQREFEHKGNLFQPPTEGSRNKTLLVQACTLFRKSELSTNAVFDIVYNAAYIASIGAKEAIDKEEVKRIVFNAQRLVGEERKKPIEDELQMRSIGEWLPEWESYHLQERSSKTFVFSEIDAVLKGRLRGKFGVAMGYGGSKKSLLALNIVDANSTGEEIAAYSNMEMNIPQFIDRVIDLKVDFGENNAHEAVVHMLKRDVNSAREVLKKDLVDKIGNKLQVIANGRMTYDKYKAAIRKLRETVGDPWCLIVDGLSMMGGKGTETEMYSQNSADLKQLANEENLFVLGICHVSKGGEKWTRDLSRLIRGSEKILDNCDFYFTMSQIQTPDGSMFRNDLGFLHFHDKRGSGKTIEVIHEFDPYRLRLKDSNVPPELYREPVNLKKAKTTELEF